MNVFLKACAGVLVAIILWLSIEKCGKDISTLLTLAVCAMILILAAETLQPVISFVKKMQQIEFLNEEYLLIILKVVGIGIVTEISSLICKDAGNTSMGKALQILSGTIVLWMSIPVFETMLDLLNDILSTI